MLRETTAQPSGPCSTQGLLQPVGGIYEIDHCTAFGRCSAGIITPSSLLGCGEQISRQRR